MKFRFLDCSKGDWGPIEPVPSPDWQGVAEELAEALKRMSRNYKTERDCQFGSYVNPTTGKIPKVDEAEVIAQMDADLDAAYAALKRYQEARK